MIRIETRRRTNPEIGMAPLIDCVLLLLIFFLLTSSFSEKRGIRICLPASETAEQVDRQPIEIAVSGVGEITFCGAVMDTANLTEALKTVVEKQGKSPVLMVADRQVRLDRVTEVIDCIRAAALETVSIATRRTPVRGQDE